MVGRCGVVQPRAVDAGADSCDAEAASSSARTRVVGANRIDGCLLFVRCSPTAPPRATGATSRRCPDAGDGCLFRLPAQVALTRRLALGPLRTRRCSAEGQVDEVRAARARIGAAFENEPPPRGSSRPLRPPRFPPCSPSPPSKLRLRTHRSYARAVGGGAPLGDARAHPRDQRLSVGVQLHELSAAESARRRAAAALGQGTRAAAEAKTAPPKRAEPPHKRLVTRDWLRCERVVEHLEEGGVRRRRVPGGAAPSVSCGAAWHGDRRRPSGGTGASHMSSDASGGLGGGDRPPASSDMHGQREADGDEGFRHENDRAAALAQALIARSPPWHCPDRRLPRLLGLLAGLLE